MIERRSMLGGMAAGLAAVSTPTSLWAVGPRPVRFGLTAVVVRENFPFFQRWSDYLGGYVGRKVEFILRRTYREIMELLETGEIDFAWICGYPFIRRREPEFLRLMAVPVFEATPLYHSYLIVHKNSKIDSIEDLRRSVFAFSDPDSNSGYLAPRAHLLDKGLPPDNFFRLTFFTYSHAETIQAVSEHIADGGAVDSYVWDYLSRTNPQSTANTRILDTIGPFGFPPLVARLARDIGLRTAMTQAILDMHRLEDGRDLLATLALDRFDGPDTSLYDGIRVMAERLSASRMTVP